MKNYIKPEMKVESLTVKEKVAVGKETEFSIPSKWE